MNPVTLQSRAWEGICAVLIFLLLPEIALLAPVPNWVANLAPIVCLLIGLDTLGPYPLFVRWRIRLERRGALRVSAVVIGLTVVAACLTLRSPTPLTDQGPVITCAARDLWHGSNPYQTYEPQCLARFQLTSAGATPLEMGPFRGYTRYPAESRVVAALTQDQERGSHAGFPAYGYPPDAALLLLPVAFSGWLGISLWVAALTALLLFAIWGLRPGATVPALAWQMCGLAMLWIIYRWNPEDLSYLLLALSFARIDRARVSSLAMAAAVCTNPLSWPCAVVYLAILMRLPLRRRRGMWLVGGIAVGILPWMAWDHNLLGQLWRFLTLPEFPLGVSLGDLARLPAQTHLIYTIGFLVGIALCALIAWWWPNWRWAMAVVVFGAFLLSWRGLLYYYMPVFWLSPAVALGACRLTLQGASQPESDAPALAGPSS
ncbi:MAG: hypothetical protein ACREN1_10170 [Candidatus Dormibacteria bacterium]